MSDREHPGPLGERSDRTTEIPATADGAALRDAQAIADRVAADEAAADAERARLVTDELPVLEPRTTSLTLLPAELLHAERRAAMLESGQRGSPVGGVLYLTSRRLIHQAEGKSHAIELSAISDMAVGMERLLLVELTDGSDVAIEVDQPRLLRVQIAVAIASGRGRSA